MNLETLASVKETSFVLAADFLTELNAAASCYYHLWPAEVSAAQKQLHYVALNEDEYACIF